jgi:hypothetical protein
LRDLRPLAVILTCLGLPAAAAAGDEPAAAEAPWFRDIALEAGVAAHHHNRSFENPYAHIMEGYTALGAAVAIADYDGDGLDDLFVTDSRDGGANHLFRNLGGLRFVDLARTAGVAEGNDATNATANALWLNRDGDGWQDLLVVRFGRSLFYENRGDGTFREIGRAIGLDRPLNAIAALAFDVEGDGDLDLVLGCYFAPVNLFDPDTPRFFPESFETADNGGGVVLYRNDGVRGFTDATAEARIRLSGWTLDLGHADADHDGDEDLYVAADFGTDRFLRNEGDGTFTDVTEEAIGVDTKKGMNAEWADFDNDGLFDVFVTNITDEYMREGNFLWRNNGDGTFTDVARETGTHDSGWGWGGKFFDPDNDGWRDLYTVNGWVSAGSGNYVLDVFELILASAEDPSIELEDARNWPPMGDKTLSGYQRNKLFLNRGGMLFRDAAPRHGVDDLRDGRGVAVADLDLDGRQDLYVANASSEAALYRNQAPRTGHWIQLLVDGPSSNPLAIGARLWLTAGGRTTADFVDGGNGFAGQSSREVHFGLGAAETVELLEVAWPSGARRRYRGLAAGRRYRLAPPASGSDTVGGARPAHPETRP